MCKKICGIDLKLTKQYFGSTSLGALQKCGGSGDGL